MALDATTARTRGFLVLGLVASLLLRLTVFSGGGAGGILCAVGYVGFAAALLVLSVRYLAVGLDDSQKLRWGLILAALLSFALILYGGEVIRQVATLTFLLSAGTMFVLWLKSLGHAIA